MLLDNKFEKLNEYNNKIMEYTSEIIKENIRKVTNKKTLSFEELSDIIIRFFGKEDENGTMFMDIQEMESIIKKILGDKNSFTALVAMQNSEQLQSILIWEYDVEKGGGYLREK